MMDDKSWIEQHPLWIPAGLVMIGIAWLLVSGYLTYNGEGWNNPGVRGDWIGGHLSAFAGLAGMALMYVAVTMQGRELQLQRYELVQSRKVAEAQANALSSQDAKLQAQNDMTWRRDNRQLMVAFAASHNGVAAMVGQGRAVYVNSSSGAKKMLTISKTATMHVVEIAETDPDFAIDLFRIYMASAVWQTQPGYNEMIEATVLGSKHFNRDGTARLEILGQMQHVMKETKT